MISIDESFQNSSEISSLGKFIVFEGCHASGKTTQAKMLCKYLQSKGIRAQYTKEPYCNDLKPLIKKYSDGDLVGSPVLMYLIAADRYLHIKDISSWMQNGVIVICDRYVLSSWVYQQIQGIPLSIIRRTNFFAIKPHLTLYIDIPLGQRIQRIRETHKEPPSFFLENGKLIKEQELYSKLIDDWDEKCYGKIIVISGHENVMKVHKTIVKVVLNEIK